MPTYRFAIHHGPAETEKLGIMTLRDDAEAFAFAKLIIQDMPDEDRTHCDRCSLDIRDGERAVGRIFCDADLGA
jgi:predicted nucleic acid-binding Zn ribbon protein